MERPPLAISKSQCFAQCDNMLEEKVNRIFYLYDKDLNDNLDLDEARPFLQQLGHDYYDLHSVQLLFDEIDKNGNGVISKEELLEYYKS